MTHWIGTHVALCLFFVYIAAFGPVCAWSFKRSIEHDRRESLKRMGADQ